jgi:hypothetical protein
VVSESLIVPVESIADEKLPRQISEEPMFITMSFDQ